jgi:hypothetical protein
VSRERWLRRGDEAAPFDRAQARLAPTGWDAVHQVAVAYNVDLLYPVQDPRPTSSIMSTLQANAWALTEPRSRLRVGHGAAAIDVAASGESCPSASAREGGVVDHAPGHP